MTDDEGKTPTHRLVPETGAFALTGFQFSGQTRYSLTAQFIAGAAVFSRRAETLEANQELSLQEQPEHRALVISAILQSVCALEAELAEVLMYGPDHYLGSSETNSAGAALLAPHVASISRESGVLRRWKEVGKILGQPLSLGTRVCQEASLLVDLRNELTHHKSQWGGALDRADVLRVLMAKRLPLPPWVPAVGLVNDFPARILVAACAHWACETAAAFLDHASDVLGFKKSVLDHYRVGDFADFLPSRA